MKHIAHVSGIGSRCPFHITNHNMSAKMNTIQLKIS